MWILPKTKSIISVCAVDMKESALDSEQFCQICVKSLLWRSKPSTSPTWLRRWKKVKFMQLLSIRTLKPSHSQTFVDAWTFYLVASRANHSAMQEIAKQVKTQGIYSHSSLKESDNADHQLSFLKMLKESSQPRQQTGNQFCSMSFESWKAWVIQQRQEYSARLKSAHLTRESECSSLAWPTATARDWKGCGNATTRKDGRNRIDNLEAAIKYGHLDRAKSNKSGKNQEFHQWATPRANKVHPEITEKNRQHLANRNKSNLEEEVAGHCGKATGKLNPNWVEQMMGLPVGWTQLPTDWID